MLRGYNKESHLNRYWKICASQNVICANKRTATYMFQTSYFFVIVVYKLGTLCLAQYSF
jgi:hypothetical protein